jgi:hypothetical protein
MCLLIAAHPNRTLPLVTFQAAVESAIPRNPDGIGIAWPDRHGQVEILKHPSNYKAVLHQAYSLYEKSSRAFILHLRFNTVGNNSKANTHPFQLSPSLAMAHNQTLDIEPAARNWSDSRTVAELLKALIAGRRDFYGSPLFWSFIEHQASDNNRFAFLDASQNEIATVNEHLGVSVDGVWFSNRYAWDPVTVGIANKNRTALHDDDWSFAGFSDDDSWLGELDSRDRQYIENLATTF